MRINNITSNDWLVDTRATDHMCHSKLLFSCLKNIEPPNTRLPNGAAVTAKLSSSVYFLDQLYLHDVLYIPSSFTILIYVSCLTDSLKCTISFTSTHSLIQGPLPWWRLVQLEFNKAFTIWIFLLSIILLPIIMPPLPIITLFITVLFGIIG